MQIDTAVVDTYMKDPALFTGYSHLLASGLGIFCLGNNSYFAVFFKNSVKYLVNVNVSALPELADKLVGGYPVFYKLFLVNFAMCRKFSFVEIGS